MKNLTVSYDCSLSLSLSIYIYIYIYICVYVCVCVCVCVGSTHVHTHICRVIQEKRSIFCEVIVLVTVRKQGNLNMRLIVNGYRERAV